MWWLHQELDIHFSDNPTCNCRYVGFLINLDQKHTGFLHVLGLSKCFTCKCWQRKEQRVPSTMFKTVPLMAGFFWSSLQLMSLVYEAFEINCGTQVLLEHCGLSGQSQGIIETWKLLDAEPCTLGFACKNWSRQPFCSVEVFLLLGTFFPQPSINLLVTYLQRESSYFYSDLIYFELSVHGVAISEGREVRKFHSRSLAGLQIDTVLLQDTDPSWDLLHPAVLSVSLCLDWGCGKSREQADLLGKPCRASGTRLLVAEAPRAKLPAVEGQVESSHRADLGDIPA